MGVFHLPHQPTAFIGRDRELSEIAALLADPNCRLLTLVGPGGIGKTRLSIQVAANQKPHYGDGIIFISLTPVPSPDLLVSVIAEALDLRVEDPYPHLTYYLRDKHLLFVMDNFDSLLDGAELLAELLNLAPSIKILVTSRERLNLSEECIYPLDGLPYPDALTTDPLEHYSALQLFIQRARQVQPHFSPDQNVEAIQSICRQVEGMPLGLELAASWLYALSCQQIATQMTENPDFLTTTVRNFPERHRSLRHVFEQSWTLLSREEQGILMRLSVFRGGFDLKAAAEVTGASLLLLAGLVDKSLLRLNTKIDRYDLHELLRQYASERLAQAQEVDSTAQRHFDYFMKFADQAERCLFGPKEIIWFDKLEPERDNLRAALKWGIHSEAGLHLAASLGWYFAERLNGKEGLAWLEQTLAANPNANPLLRAKALHHAGALAGHLEDKTQLRIYCYEAIALAQSVHDDWSVAWALSHLGGYSDCHSVSEMKQSAAQLEESIALFRKIGDLMGLAHTLVRLAWKIMDQKNYAYAQILVDEAANLTEKADDTIMRAWVTDTKGLLAKNNHHFDQARVHFEKSIELFRQVGFPDQCHRAAIKLALVELEAGNVERASKLYKEVLMVQTNTFLLYSPLPSILAGMAIIAKVRGQLERSAKILGALRGPEIGQIYSYFIPDFEEIEREIIAIRAEMGQAAFDAAWASGAAMTKDEIIAYIREESTALNNTKLMPSASNFLLSERELEVLKLIAEGRSNQEIADRLYIGLSTVKKHINHIYDKLDAKNRTQAINFARERLILP